MSVKKANVSVIVTMLVSLCAAVEDFYIFNSLDDGKARGANYYEDRLNNCFDVFGSLSKIPHNKRQDSDFIKKLEDIQNEMTTEITTLFKFFGLFDKQEEHYADLIVRSYHIVPYHNICHGLVVGMYSFTFFYSNFNFDKLTKDLINADARSIFLAGLLHDIGHPGYTNPMFKEQVSKDTGLDHPRNFRLFRMQPKGDGIVYYDNDNNKPTIAKGPISECKMADDVVKKFFPAKMERLLNGNGARKKTVTTETILKNGFDNIRVARGLYLESPKTAAFLEAEKLKQPDRVKIMGYNVPENEVAPWVHINEHPVISVLCESAELVHAIYAYEIITQFYGKDTRDVVHTDDIVYMILSTNMALGFSGIHFYKEQSWKMNLVHVADLMGNVAQNKDLRLMMLKQLFFEFTLESFDKTAPPAGIDYLDLDGQPIGKDKQFDPKKHTGLNKRTFIEEQKKFISGLIKAHIPNELKETQLFANKENGYLARLDSIVDNFSDDEFNKAEQGLEMAKEFGHDYYFRII